MPACQRQLIEITTPHDFLRRLALDPNPQNRLPFTLEGHSGELRLGASDTLVIYIKGHGLAIDISQTDAPDVRPLLIKSLSETDLATPWFRDEAHTIDVGVLLAGLAKLPELRKLVILDAVHLSYDPRLGSLVNAFPQAVREAVERLPQRSNLWVVLGQGDGELGVGLPGADRSAFVDCLVKQLERKPGGGGSVNVDDLIAKTQSSLDTLVRGGFGSFKQTLQKSFPSRSGPSAALLLPTSPPPPPEGQESGGGSAAGGISAKLARKVRLPSAVSGAVSTARKGQRVAAKISKATAAKPDKQEPADTAANKGAPASSDGKSATAAAPAAPGDKSPAPGCRSARQRARAEPAAAKSDLDLAWEAHDRLRSRPRDGWSPVHVAPDEWRRVEGLLAGFDEEELTRGLARATRQRSSSCEVIWGCWMPCFMAGRRSQRLAPTNAKKSPRHWRVFPAAPLSLVPSSPGKRIGAGK